jgi:predicted AAA+ superfamily ATPase
MKRLVEGELLSWKEAGHRKPLVLRGARQVGKTWLVERFLAPLFETFVKIDFEKRRDLRAIFDENLDPARILSALEIARGKIVPGKTLLFLDEIQACPRALAALRYFYEEMPELHIVAAGSLLEFALGDISVPVGRLSYMRVGPMNFQEYLLAVGKEVMAEALTGNPESIDTSSHGLILQELRNYFFVGGMPEALKLWRDTGSMREAARAQEEILLSLKDDFSKYTPRVAPDCLDGVLQNAARSVGEQLKYTKLDESHSGPTNRKAFDLLCKARLLHRIPACDPSGLPLGATANPVKFKAALLDIGLMQRACRLPMESALDSGDLLSLYRGKLAEQFVAQEMLAAGEGELFYWARDARGSSAEVDYLAVRTGKIHPVEVKSGEAGSLRSLHLFLKNYPNCPTGIILSSRPPARLAEQRLSFLPLYFAGQLSRADFEL